MFNSIYRKVVKDLFVWQFMLSFVQMKCCIFMDVLNEINNQIINQDVERFPNDLFNGKMGLCIYFYSISRLLHEEKYSKYAELLLKSICSFMMDRTITCINFDKGLSGIAWGIIYLHKNKFIQGNLDNILCELDNFIFRTIHFNWLENKDTKRIDVLGILFYYIERYPTVQNREERILIEKTLRRLLNYMDANFNNAQWVQPKEFNLSRNILSLYLIVLSRIYKQEIYKNKIISICNSLSDVVVSTIPLSYANRMFYLLGLQSITSCIDLPKWKKHIDWLRSDVNIEQIIKNEFFNKELSFGRGLAGYIWILSLFEDKEMITVSLKQLALEKIQKSDIWLEVFNPYSSSLLDNIGFFNGYAGLAYIYYSLLI